MTRSAIRYIPMRADEFRKLMRRLYDGGCTIEMMAKKFGKKSSWITNQLFGQDTPERLALEDKEWLYKARFCVAANPSYTIEELAIVLNETVERLKS